jgi:hypothetical protein
LVIKYFSDISPAIQSYISGGIRKIIVSPVTVTIQPRDMDREIWEDPIFPEISFVAIIQRRQGSFMELPDIRSGHCPTPWRHARHSSLATIRASTAIVSYNNNKTVRNDKLNKYCRQQSSVSLKHETKEKRYLKQPVFKRVIYTTVSYKNHALPSNIV